MSTNKNYSETVSYVDEWVTVENFNLNRWMDSTGGIHF
ncbi:DUF5758 domain-containing protein [Enterococcus hermanniensis]|nr:DUF5758 domain-containing protein [Enterococcus hermanniensis]